MRRASELLATFPGESLGAVSQDRASIWHLYSAFNVSPFEEANVVSSMFRDILRVRLGNRPRRWSTWMGRVFSASLGAFYEAITQYLGFPNYGDE